MSFLKEANKIFQQAEKAYRPGSKPNDFADLAEELLSKTNIHKSYNQKAIAEIMSNTQWPHQYYQMGVFGDVPFTLFRNQHFFLDVYFWQMSDSNIHDHHFTGAFKMLTGDQTQLEYRFEPERKVTNYLTKGKFEHINTKKLKIGETQKILLGGDFIHHTLHEPSQLTANLCLRSTTFEGKNLSAYFYHGFKLEHLGKNDERLRKFSLINLMPKGARADALFKFLDTQDDHMLITVASNDNWTAKIMTLELKKLILRYIKEARPALWKKTSDFIGGYNLHQKRINKLKVFIYDT